MATIGLTHLSICRHLAPYEVLWGASGTSEGHPFPVGFMSYLRVACTDLSYLMISEMTPGANSW